LRIPDIISVNGRDVFPTRSLYCPIAGGGNTRILLPYQYHAKILFGD
jgi:hypothetical protein